ncbi:alpha/beta hydrolase family protein [Paludibacterium purpuratum]|uniref:Alpha/beta hydrolase family protein DUF1100 n=1 Tax=Paludibacterium purpuratum TaxID=1144873 RepID=A0A4R7BBS7_9NEIS|nr:prolyl oligopeptidase family serine peptidase [Paludibacterium purpuratum]TDR81552.1 alpha/beta hydrolase family protein DUF1100 [Paludibacterium purpuratum]
MRNISDTQSYSMQDHFFSRAIYALSRVIGVKNITRPFWNRWRAALFANSTLERFLSAIKGLSDWADAGQVFLEQEIAAFGAARGTLEREQEVAELRRLSFLAHLVQWGCMPLTDLKKNAYRMARDFYVEAETLQHGSRFARLPVDYGGHRLWGNLHLPETHNPTEKCPLVVIIHGMDDVKEEHLASELLFQAAGCAVFSIDGPGQGEAFLLDGVLWEGRFEEAIIASVNTLARHPIIDTEYYAICGISWGGMWAYKVAAKDPRVAFILDLGGPIHATDFSKLPFFLKSKFCQIFGLASPDDYAESMLEFCINDDGLLSRVRAKTHIVHGDKDPIVPTKDKVWLADTLNRLGHTQATISVYPDGDHCCTQHVAEIRQLAAQAFLQIYQAHRQAAASVRVRDDDARPNALADVSS